MRPSAARFGALLLCGGICSIAIGQYDTILAGNLRFIRHQQVAGGLGYNYSTSVACGNGIAAVTFLFASAQNEFDSYIRHYDSWGRPRHDPVMIDPVLAHNAYRLSCVRHGGRSCVYWNENTGSFSLWLRIYGDDGLPVTPAVLANDQYLIDSGYTRGFRLTADRILLFQIGRTSGSSPRRAFVKVFDHLGNPQSALTQIGTLPSGNIYGFSMAMDELGNALVAYAVKPGLEESRCLMQRVGRDLSFSAPFIAAGPPAFAPDLGYLASGTFAFTHTANAQGGTQYARRIDSSGAALTPWLILTDNSGSAEYLADGRALIVAHDDPTVDVVAKYLDSEWQPITPEFDYTREPAPPVHDYSDVIRTPAYDESGTAWIVWTAYGGGANTYLTTLHPYLPADMNSDNRVNNFDIDAFVLALSDPAAYAAQYDVPLDVIRIYGDCNGDGAFNNFDIDAFIECLNNGGCP